ncbi:MAG: hypothetical protein ACI8ZA_002754 [Gammaproteobacteria bacterium]|jgi:hypothetical protein
MLSFTLLFTLFMLPSVCVLATSLIVAHLEQGN